MWLYNTYINSNAEGTWLDGEGTTTTSMRETWFSIRLLPLSVLK